MPLSPDRLQLIRSIEAALTEVGAADEGRLMELGSWGKAVVDQMQPADAQCLQDNGAGFGEPANAVRHFQLLARVPGDADALRGAVARLLHVARAVVRCPTIQVLENPRVIPEPPAPTQPPSARRRR